MSLNEDTPVTTTDNAGVGLDEPKLPINSAKNMFRRVKDMSDKKKKSDENLK